jgi:mRNA interferase RelE/StbE
MKVLQSLSFSKVVRRFSERDKRILDQQVRAVMENPGIGREKRGELRGVFVHKFKIHTVQYLLAYRLKSSDLLELIMIGPHENYYRDLEKYLKDRKD